MHEEWVVKEELKKYGKRETEGLKEKLVEIGLKRKNSGKGVKETRPNQWQKVNPVAKGLNKSD